MNKRGYFEGWYFKQQNNTETIALIPAYHMDKSGRALASLQIITDTRACNIDFPPQVFKADRKKFVVRLAECTFSAQGCELSVKSSDCTLKGRLRFGAFARPAYDIMGPFRFVPLMQCRHSVFSFRHRVDGELIFNGNKLIFENARGYIEGDRGSSFPSRYLWTHCNWEDNSIMLAVAHIPFGGTSFTGCIGFIYRGGQERRIATYCGVKLLYIEDDTVLLRQGHLLLKIQLLDSGGHLLRAPLSGSMTRKIHESPSCRVQYTCWEKGNLLFDFISEQASFESNWGLRVIQPVL